MNHLLWRTRRDLCFSASDQRLQSNRSVNLMDLLANFAARKVALTGHERVSKVVFSVLVILDIFPLERVTATAVYLLVDYSKFVR